MEQIAIPAGLQSKLCILGDDILNEVPKRVQELWPGAEVIVIADENTWNAAGKRVSELLAAAGIKLAEPKIFSVKPQLHADYEHITEIVPLLKGRTPVAVGSGTINDITKRASFEAGCAGYLCVATACSVDGYTSFGAAISVDNFKKTLQCPAPLAIIADSRILSTAPAEMTAAGYADLAAKIVAGSDWLIADALGETPLDMVAWNMVQKNLRFWLDEPERLVKKDPERLSALFNGLVSTGFAMQYYKESRPASGAEHLFSHVWEMDGVLKDGMPPSHGFKVSVGTLISCAMHEYAFKVLTKEQVAESCATAPEVSQAARLAQIDSYLKGSQIYENVKQVCLEKLKTGDDLRKRREQLVENWESLRDKTAAQNLPFEEIKRRFLCVHCPVKIDEIGVDRDELYRGMNVACMIRKRYNIMDYLYEAGLYDKAMDYAAAKVL